MAIPILTAGEMQRIDRLTIDKIGIAGTILMEQAGRACAEAIEELLEGKGKSRVAIFCGKGNNGGDGLVAARYLRNSGQELDVYLVGEGAQPKGDAQVNLRVLEKLNQPILPLHDLDALKRIDWSRYTVVLDAVFGTGLSSEVRGIQEATIRAICDARLPVVSIDLPSGLSADTGQVLGCAVRATQTVTFGAPKRGHLLHPGAALVGDLTVVDIGFPPELFPAGDGSTWLLTDEDMHDYLQPRETDAHKGRFGHLLVLAGSEDKPGAAALCCSAAVRSGAGLVTLAGPEPVLQRAVHGPVEFMGRPVRDFRSLSQACRDKQALALGPGLGQSDETAALVRQAVSELQLPMVIDADGLNNLAGHLDLLAEGSTERVLTPHPGELARLFQITSGEIQKDRLGWARKLSERCHCVTVLKGANTVVADEAGTAFFIPTGNPGMASGGTGDVLTGVIGSLLCQGMSPLEAASVGAYLHGLAGDAACARRGQRGLAAGDLIAMLPEVIKRFEGIRDIADDQDS